MNCKQTREAIDTAMRRALYGDTVTSHLSGCPDCRRHADETNSLLMLLSAQPRVQAPADFDFRLRAGIARAQATQANPASVIERIWERLLAQTFSWGQAATAMAAVALVITVTTFYTNHDNSVSAPTDVVAINGKVDQPLTRVESAPETKTSMAEPIRAAAVKLTNRSVKPAPAVFKSEESASVVALTDIASVNASSRFYSRETKQLVTDRPNLYGAEAASVNSAKSTVAALTF